MDIKLSIDFGEDETKCILFSKEQNLELNITYNSNRIKQFHIVECLDCYLDAILYKKSMEMKSLKKIKGELQFLHGQNEFLNS